MEMTMEQEIKVRLEKHFPNCDFEIVNQSHLHSGHAGSPNTGQSHFHLTIVSDKFSGISRVKRHQMVYEIFDDLLKSDIHALALQLDVPK